MAAAREFAAKHGSRAVYDAALQTIGYPFTWVTTNVELNRVMVFFTSRG